MHSILRCSSSHAGRKSCFHSSALAQAQRVKPKGFVRSRLVADLTPSSKTAQYEIAPEGPTSWRDDAPHLNLNPIHRQKGKKDGGPAKSPNRSPDVQEERSEEPASLLDILESAQSEFYEPPATVSLSPSHAEGDAVISQSSSRLPTVFESPPLLPGFLPALEELVGSNARPTPIQALSIKWLIEQSPNDAAGWKQFLLAAETGSGKSLAYLLPVLQHLKMTEEAASARRQPNRPLNPRALILAPTHELARQLTRFAKALTRGVPLRTACASQANNPSMNKREVTVKKLSEQMDALVDGSTGEFELEKGKAPVDILVGTPVKLMELVRGRGWDRLNEELEENGNSEMQKLRRGRDKLPGVGKWRREPELGLENVEWVVVDEADILFDPDFHRITRTLLADVSAARGVHVPVTNASSQILSQYLAEFTGEEIAPEPVNYPFNLILTSATIPKNLARYLDRHHPDLVRLSSPHLHRLPKSLKVEYSSWTGGNKFADIEHRIRRVWADDVASVAAHSDTSQSKPNISKILIFCNRSTKVTELAEYLEEKGIKTIALTSTSEQRKRGTNKHLEGFLRPVNRKDKQKEPNISTDPKVTPHVMITTSLLSRGLDFAPSIQHVFIVDEPRNMIDFLHRAGRSGRAGRTGKVVIFTKLKGRGSTKGKETISRVKTLLSSKAKIRKE